MTFSTIAILAITASVMAESRSANVRSSTQILAERFSEESGNVAHFFNLKIAGTDGGFYSHFFHLKYM
jgi:hypothetical protein